MMSSLNLSAVFTQFLVGLSRAMILFIVTSGLSLVLGVLRIPNIAHGSLYMIGAFMAFTIASLMGSGTIGFWLSLAFAPLAVALISLIVERGLLSRLYEREPLMKILFTFSLALVLGDLVKIVWGPESRSVSVPEIFQGSYSVAGSPFPRYNLFLVIVGPLVALGLWFFINKTNIGKISRASAADREMVGAVGINVSWIFAMVFGIGCFLAGLGGALVAPTQNIVIGMDQTMIMEALLIVIIGGLGNLWGALLGALIFGISHSLGLLLWSQFAIIFPYIAVILVLVVRPKGLLKSTW